MKRRSRVCSNLIICMFLISSVVFGNITTHIEPVSASTTVYVTRTGTKYHSHKCGNGTYYQESLANAKADGLEPCKKCFPNGAPSDSSSSSSSKKTKAKAKVKLNYSSKVLIVLSDTLLSASATN